MAFSNVMTRGHQFARPFQCQESGMAFIHVPDGRIEAHRP